MFPIFAKTSMELFVIALGIFSFNIQYSDALGIIDWFNEKFVDLE